MTMVLMKWALFKTRFPFPPLPTLVCCALSCVLGRSPAEVALRYPNAASSSSTLHTFKDSHFQRLTVTLLPHLTEPVYTMAPRVVVVTFDCGVCRVRKTMGRLTDTAGSSYQALKWLVA